MIISSLGVLNEPLRSESAFSQAPAQTRTGENDLLPGLVVAIPRRRRSGAILGHKGLTHRFSTAFHALIQV